MPASLLALALTTASPGAPASPLSEAPATTPATAAPPLDAPATSPDADATSLEAPTTSPDAPPTSPAAPTTSPDAPATSSAAPTTSAAPAAASARPRWWGPEPRPRVSGYGGPALRLAGLHGQFAAFVGVEGGINIVQRITIGAALQWLLNPVEAGAFAVGGATRINLNFGGLVVDVAYVRGKRVAGTLGGLLGGGGGCLQNPENGHCADRTAFFVGEPRAGLRVTLAPIVRLHLALGYRLVAARAWAGPRDLGGPAGTIALEFGWF